MTNGIAMWGDAAINKARGKKLGALQEKNVKNIFSKYVNSGTTGFKTFRILKLSDVYTLRACMYIVYVPSFELESTLHITERPKSAILESSFQHSWV